MQRFAKVRSADDRTRAERDAAKAIVAALETPRVSLLMRTLVIEVAHAMLGVRGSPVRRSMTDAEVVMVVVARCADECGVNTRDVVASRSRSGTHARALTVLVLRRMGWTARRIGDGMALSHSSILQLEKRGGGWPGFAESIERIAGEVGAAV